MVLVLYSACLFAQESISSGSVIYQSVRRIDIKFNQEMAHLESLFPKEQKALMELLFTTNESLYQNAKTTTDEEVIKETIGGGSATIRMQQANNIIHTDLKGKVKTELREFMSRKFLIETNIDTLKWKLTGQSKQVLNYHCLAAEVVGSEKPITVWFAPQIPISAGPADYSGLPGVILAVEIDGGKTAIVAQSVSLNSIDGSQIKKPRGGKKLSHKEFDIIVKEKTEEMQQGDGIIIFAQ